MWASKLKQECGQRGPYRTTLFKMCSSWCTLLVICFSPYKNCTSTTNRTRQFVLAVISSLLTVSCSSSAMACTRSDKCLKNCAGKSPSRHGSEKYNHCYHSDALQYFRTERERRRRDTQRWGFVAHRRSSMIDKTCGEPM